MRNKYIGGVLSAVLLITAEGCSTNRDETDDGVVLDITSIAHKRPQEVKNLLGDPSKAYWQKSMNKRMYVQIYQPHQIEIYFPDSTQATEVVVHEPGTIPYSAEALKFFKLDVKPPSEIIPNTALKWKNYPGIQYISMLATDIQADSVITFRIYFNLKK
ncbi:hypothetical protein D770_16850 [Flammeovirgaceae bacterium 311]|nr:hypothetical protein D770_16850 [Flammeovirgaceae bacterium 311]